MATRMQETEERRVDDDDERERLARLETGLDNEREWRRMMLSRMNILEEGQRDILAQTVSNLKWTIGTAVGVGVGLASLIVGAAVFILRAIG